jgi:hypothetical protein
MIALRLVHLIEHHSDELAETLTHRLLSSERTCGLRKVPTAELHQRCHDVYRHLSDWLLTKTESEIQEAYGALGARRASQRVPLADLTWALMLTKENLFDFLVREGIHGSVESVLRPRDLSRHRRLRARQPSDCRLGRLFENKGGGARRFRRKREGLAKKR